MAAISAIEEVFPNVVLSGCFFHYAQSLWRKLQSLGLQQDYCNDEIFAIQARQFAALAFVPVEVIYTFYCYNANCMLLQKIPLFMFSL